MSEQVQFEEDTFGRGSGPAGFGRTVSSDVSKMEKWLIDKEFVSTAQGARNVLVGFVVLNFIVAYLVISNFVL